MARRKGGHFRNAAFVVLSCLALSESGAQELPKSGVWGIDLVYASNESTNTSQLYGIMAQRAVALPIGSPVATAPSRWSHRRRTLGALEPEIVYASPLVLLTAMGTQVGDGAIHFVDGRAGLPVVSSLVPTGNPASYDLALFEPFQFVFAVEDDGVGTTLRGFTYAVSGQLLPLNPPSLSLPGRPAAYVNRIGVDVSNGLLHVPTATGIQVVSLFTSAPQMQLGAFVSSGSAAPATNPLTFTRGGTTTWIVGTSTFNGVQEPDEGGYFAWDASGTSFQDGFGQIPGRSPPRNYVPAAGTEELAVVSNGTDTYAYFLLRDPSPSSLFIRPSAIGTIRFLGTAAPVIGTIVCPDPMGEPFAIPTVSGTRIAIESSEGPPFFDEPPGGAEKISILYTPLDSLGAGTSDGVLAVAGPLNGRISTKGMDRPIWTDDGLSVISYTSHFPGAPNPGVPGIEILDVPRDVLVNEFNSPHVLVENPTSPNQSIILPTKFDAREPGAADFLQGFTFSGNVFHDGMASAMLFPFGEIGQKQLQSPTFVQSPAIPNFPAILPPSFEDATGSLTPVPGMFGARRTTFNLIPDFGLAGLIMSFAYENSVLIQASGANFLAEIGLGSQVRPIIVPLPVGLISTTEILSL